MKLVLLAGIGSLLLACGFSPDYGGQQSGEWSPYMTEREQRFAQLSTDVPGFRGLGSTAEAWVVYIREEALRAEARDAISNLFGDGSVDGFLVAVKPEQGMASESLKHEAGAVMGSGAHSLDFDETTGYLRIGIRSPERISAVETALRDVEISVHQAILEVQGVAVAL